MSKILIIAGDLFKAPEDQILCHQVNCQGVMGSGVAYQVRRIYPHVYQQYREFVQKIGDADELLGHCQIVPSNGMFPRHDIANLFAQKFYGTDGKKYTSDKAFEQALRNLSLMSQGRPLAFPYLIGCNRGGGSWAVIYSLIERVLPNDVFIYKL